MSQICQDFQDVWAYLGKILTVNSSHIRISLLFFSSLFIGMQSAKHLERTKESSSLTSRKGIGHNMCYEGDTCSRSRHVQFFASVYLDFGGKSPKFAKWSQRIDLNRIPPCVNLWTWFLATRQGVCFHLACCAYQIFVQLLQSFRLLYFLLGLVCFLL